MSDETTRPESPSSQAPEPTPHASSSRRRAIGTRALLAGIAVVGLLFGATFGGVLGAKKAVRDRLGHLAVAAGLRLELGSLSVCTSGRVEIEGLAFLRADGSAVVKADSLVAVLPPSEALSGRRRPRSLELVGMKLDVRVQDGKPDELMRLREAWQSVFPRTKRSGEATVSKLPAVRIERGEARVSFSGRGAELLQAPVELADLGATLDPETASGKITGLVRGGLQAELRGEVTREASGIVIAKARFEPALVVPLPAGKVPLGATGLRLTGLSWATGADGGGGLDEIVLLAGQRQLARAKAVRLASEGGLGLVASGLEAELPLPQGALAVAGPQPGKGALAGASKVQIPRTLKLEAEALRVAIGKAADRGGRPLLATLEKLRVPLPDDLGIAGIERVAVRVDAGEGRFSERIQSVVVTGPSIDVPWTEASMTHLPGGSRLYRAVEEARRMAAQAATKEDDDDDDDDERLPPEARRRKQLRGNQQGKGGAVNGKAAKPPPGGKGDGKGKKAPEKRTGPKLGGPGRLSASAAIGPVMQKIHGKLKRLDDAAERLASILGARPGLDLRVEGGRLGFVRTGESAPFGGLKDGTITIAARGADGRRAIQVGATPFDGDTVWGKVGFSATTGVQGRIETIVTQLQGPHFAQGLRLVSPGVSVRDGADVKADITITPDAKPGAWKAKGHVETARVGIDYWRIARKPIDEFSASMDFDSMLDLGQKTLDLKVSRLRVGEAWMAVDVKLQRIDQVPTLRFGVEMPMQDCGAVGRSIPAALIPRVGPIVAKGEIAWKVVLNIDLAHAYNASLDTAFDDAKCEVTSMGIDVGTIGGQWKAPVNENGVLLDDVIVGPASGAYTTMEHLPPWVPFVMMMTEDGAFHDHRGFAPGLILRAIKLDVDRGRFVYGGSTITQQLVKNLYLDRDKTLGRKFEEAVIVWQMERRLDKDRILETYCNVIEFGPKIYGVTNAADIYFGKPASQLTPLEAAFLAANKPCPRCGYARFKDKTWDLWWQNRMVGIMTKLRDKGTITEAQFADEAPYVPRFVGWPKPGGQPTGGMEDDDAAVPARKVGGEEE